MDNVTTRSNMSTESFITEIHPEEKKGFKRPLDQAFKENRQKIILKKRLNLTKTTIETCDSGSSFTQTLNNTNLYEKRNYTTFTPLNPIRHKSHTVNKDFLKSPNLLSFTSLNLLKSEWNQETFLRTNVISHPIRPHSFCFPSIDETLLNVNEEYLEFRYPIPQSLTNSTLAFIRKRPTDFMNINKDSNEGYHSLTDMKHKPVDRLQPSQFIHMSSTSTQKKLGHLNLMCGIREIWYQKYQPKTFLDLISEESFNRQLLSLLNKIKKSQGCHKVDVTKSTSSENIQNKQNTHLLKTFEIMKPKSEPEMKNIGAIAAAQQSSVDMSSIVLIAGPSGSGKSSAARILARQAGDYRFRI
ncbi:uncharacterized protein LOC128883007 isoform X2 [Hylaeus volcanicus]|uniref:uncharacterized protein LOC128883007 isoform X2 n=1 Tax=Hylaeus volcanicus TaxID=313075 RepID=UPI0023B7FBEC|nr:uncharacterized protein LOC128883007 isoform X2 [Hylaeus volcanicus]